MGRGDRHVGLPARARRPPVRAARRPHRPLRVRLQLQRLSGLAGGARRRGLADLADRRRRVRAAEGGQRAGGRGRAAGPVRDRAGRTDLRAARQRVPAPVVGEADRGRRTRARAGRSGAAGTARRRARPRGVDARPRRAADRRRVQRDVAGRHADDGRGARGGGRRDRVGRRARLDPRRAAAGGRGAAVGGAPAVDPRGGVPGHLDDRHRARAGVRAALPADRRDGRRRLDVAA